MSVPVQKKLVRITFSIIACVLVSSLFVAYLSGRAVLKAHQRLILETEILDHLNVSLSTMKDAETGQRGFLLTGEPEYLEPFNAARRQINEELSWLMTLSARGDLPSADVSRFNELSQAKLTELGHSIELRQKEGFAPALAVMQTGHGKETMDALRSVHARLTLTSTRKLADLHASTLRLSTFRTATFIVAALLNLAFLRWAYYRIGTEAARREAVAADVARQKELLSVTLGSIGDGVIVTDLDSRITFVNRVAIDLTGWPSSEALGKRCTDVFNIINESTRQPAENPVEKVLRTGVIAGLANHTILICRDGREIPIDDSGAPIHASDGKIRGVVLVFRDFSDHKQAEAELRRAKEAAEEANIAKDNFLATLSHELRTPLTPVATTLAVWEEEGKLPPAFIPDVQVMRRNVALEARLIDDLLDLTRIVRGKLTLNPEVASIHELIRDVASMYQSEVNSSNLKLSMHLEATRPYVYVDPGRLQQIFWNIFKNATKFTPKGGTIDVSTDSDDSGRVKIDIRDDGIGMTPETIAKLFRPFEQGTDEIVKRYGGLGLGMAISKALIDALGGTIKASSQGMHKGSTFTVELPTVNPPYAATPQASALPANVQEVSRRILLVEDHTDTANAMSRLLRGLGHDVTIADSVSAAMQALPQGSFNLLLSDIGLPDGTGMDLIRQIRKSSRIPAIALTGFGMEDDVADCKAAGFDEHLTKPINFQKLKTVIDQIRSE